MFCICFYCFFIVSSQISRHVDDSVTKGAKVLLGGSVCEELNGTGGTFYKPTVLVNMTQEMLPFKQETFGPLAALLKFSTEEEAVIIANNTPYVLNCDLYLSYNLY